MKYTELKDLTVEELRKRERTSRKELTDIKLKHVMGQVANPIEIRFKRRDIARVKSALSAKLK